MFRDWHFKGGGGELLFQERNIPLPPLPFREYESTRRNITQLDFFGGERGNFMTKYSQNSNIQIFSPIAEYYVGLLKENICPIEKGTKESNIHLRKSG